MSVLDVLVAEPPAELPVIPSVVTIGDVVFVGFMVAAVVGVLVPVAWRSFANMLVACGQSDTDTLNVS